MEGDRYGCTGKMSCSDRVGVGIGILMKGGRDFGAGDAALTELFKPGDGGNGFAGEGGVFRVGEGMVFGDNSSENLRVESETGGGGLILFGDLRGGIGGGGNFVIGIGDVVRFLRAGGEEDLERGAKG